MSNVVIETTSLTRYYRQRAVIKELNLRVVRGAIYGFLGSNGAGKTTTLRMLVGLLQPSSGYVRLFDLSLAEHRVRCLARVGALTESPAAFRHLTGRENLEYIRRLRGAAPSDVTDGLQLLGLSVVKDQRVCEYSLGMRQRLGIASALIGKPELLILDEPTNGLDPEGIAELRALLKQLVEQRGVTILLSSHLLNEVEQIVTHIGILKSGYLLFQGSFELLQQQIQPQLHITVDKPDKALALIHSWNIIASVNGHYIIASVPASQAGSINHLLVTNGITVNSLCYHTKTLEQQYLDLVTKMDEEV